MDNAGKMAVVGGGIAVALLLGVLAVTSGDNASATKSQGVFASSVSEKADVTATEANTWAEARAADTAASYRTYLAAYPDGAFASQAHEAVGRVTAVRTTTTAKSTPVVARGPSRATIRARCNAYANSVLKPASKTTRAGVGAAAGCAVGALAGGSDGRNCAIGAVAGGATGYVTAGNRERKREEIYQTCVANGGPG